MAKIEKLDLTAKLTARADELQKKLAKLTGDTSDDYERACAKADLLIERQRGGVLVPEGNPNDGRFRMVPDQSLRSTQQVNAVLAFKQKQLERAIRVAEGKLRAEADPAKKAELSNKLAQTKETLGEVVREKVTARTLSMNEIMELNQRLRKEYNLAIRAGDTGKAEQIRQQQIELSKDRRSRGGIRTRI